MLLAHFQQMIFGDENARTLQKEDRTEIGSKEKKRKPVTLQKNATTGKVDIDSGFMDTEVSEFGENQTTLNCAPQTKHKSTEKQTLKEAESEIEVPSKEKVSKKKKVLSARKGSALEFVRKFRKESLNNPSLSKTREDEISEIGVSLHQRMMDISRQTQSGASLVKGNFSKKNFVKKNVAFSCFTGVILY
jgi:hypothetical protein